MAKKVVRNRKRSKPAGEPDPPPVDPTQENIYRNRVDRLEMIRAGDLGKHELNFRVHPSEQTDAMRGVLEEIGWVDAVLAFEEDGNLVLFDGHLRQDLAPDDVIPVLVTDLTREEADKALLTHDHVTQLAHEDALTLTSLIERIQAEDAALRAMIDDMGAAAEKKQEKRTAEPVREIDNLALMPYEHYDYVLVLCRTRHEFGVLSDVLDLPEIPRDRRNSGMGLGRGIEANKLIGMLNGNNGDRHTQPAPSAEHGEHQETGAGSADSRR